jgi:hypothetical protein
MMMRNEMISNRNVALGTRKLLCADVASELAVKLR